MITAIVSNFLRQSQVFG